MEINVKILVSVNAYRVKGRAPALRQHHVQFISTLCLDLLLNKIIMSRSYRIL